MLEKTDQHDRRINAQVSRLALLQQITHSIGSRHDLNSIFQVVLRSLEEHLPIDFGCVCLHDAANGTVSVESVGTASAPLCESLGLASARSCRSGTTACTAPSTAR